MAISYSPGDGGAMMKLDDSATANETPGSARLRLPSESVSGNAGETRWYASKSPTSCPLMLTWLVMPTSSRIAWVHATNSSSLRPKPGGSSVVEHSAYTAVT